jgi:methionyl-tRNA formyltransferase
VLREANLRIIFMGTPHFAVPTLTEILGHGHDVAAVYTRVPKPAGRRGLEPIRSPVHQAADRFGIEVFTPKTLRSDDAADHLRRLAPEVVVVVAYGLILPSEVLAVPAAGCLNLHASLLPRWRGAAPIQRAVMAGDRETGIMVMRMEEGLDTGPVALHDEVPIPPEATGGEMHDLLAKRGADLMVHALAALGRGSLVFTPQKEEGVTYAHKIEKAEARIDWTEPARAIHDRVRALSPFPGAYFEADLGKGFERVKILRSALAEGAGPPGQVLETPLVVACGENALRVVEIQRAGKAPLSADDFQRGARLKVGSLLAAL